MSRLEKVLGALRWIARFVSAILYVVLLSFAFGDGWPDPSVLATTEGALLAATLVIITGLLIAWFWEGPGALLILAGFLAFAIANQGLPQNIVFVSVVITGFLFLFIWWRARIAGLSGMRQRS